ncbi:MAG: histone H1 [Acidobacteria bacterium]|nr:MAG: histone H1 [Acidobacteriota bacterium]
MKRTRDENALAKSVVDSILDELEQEPKPIKEKDPRAVKRGRQGGSKGGKARAEKLSAEKRKEIAKKAAHTRWKS